MKITCTQNDLNTNLSLVSRAVPSRPTHPILGNVLLVANAEAQKITLTAFDLSLGIQTSFAATVESDGKLTIPAKLLSDIVSRLPSEEITLFEMLHEDALDDNDSRIVILTSTSGQYKMRGLMADEFPSLPKIEVGAGVAIQLPAEALKQGLSGTLFATSTDETKQQLTGIHLTVQQDRLEFAATDGHRLAVVEAINQDESQATENASPFNLTVPAKALRELERMIGTEPVTLHFEQGQIVFQSGEQRLTSRTLEAQYPAYRQLIPATFERQVTIERRQLLSAVERIAVLADQKNNAVKFNIDTTNQQLTLSVEAADVGSGQESLSIQFTGDDLEIAFNVKYLIDGLKVLPTAEIQLLMNSAVTPVILTPLGELKMTYLIMPIQIRK